MVKQIFFLIAATCMFSTAAFAQSKDQAAVAQAVDNLKKAMIDADSTTLAAIAHEALSYGHSSGKTEDKASFVSSIASGKSDFQNMNLSDQTIQVVNNTATVRHALSAQINDGGNAGNVKLLVLLVWVKEKGQWKLLARQAVRQP